MSDNLKSKEESVREFVISTSRIPFVRAGWANLLIFFMVIAAFLSHKFAIHFGFGFGMSLLVAAVAAVFFLALYSRSLSRIVIENSVIQFICAIHRESLHVPSIKRIKVLGDRSSSLIIIVVFLDNKVLPRVFHFTKLYPSAEEFHATVADLRKFLERTGATVTQPRELFKGTGANDL